MPIEANVTNNQISASVSETQIDVNVSGGVGPTGTSGAAATVTVGTVTTGAPGSSASVVNAGSSSAAVLNFTIPAGATGAQGATGATGPAGTTTWDGITDKPETFSPSEHTHSGLDILLAESSVEGYEFALADETLQDFLFTLSSQSGIVTGVATRNAAFRSWIGAAGTTHTHDASNITAGTLNAARLPTTAVTAGSYGSASSVATYTVDSTGRLTAAGSTAIAISAGAVSGLGALATFATSGSPSASNYLRGDGAWTAITTYTLPNATTSTLGGVIVGTGLSVASGTVSVSYGTSSGTSCQGNDSRLTDSRSPTSHASSHASGGSDALSLAASQITSGTVATARLGSGTASSSTFLRGDQTYADPITYATQSEAETAISATGVVNPARAIDAIRGHYTLWPNVSVTASGGSITGFSSGTASVMSLNSSATANGSALLYSSGGANNLWALWSQGVASGQAWGKRRTLRVRMARHNTTNPSANMFCRVIWGRNAATLGQLNAAGISLEVRNSRIWLLSHNGTSLTETDSGQDFANNDCFDFLLVSDGAGNCTLFRNGTSIATNTGGPTATATGWASLHYQVGNGGDANTNLYSFGPSTVSYS